jgi:hypothetical protein
VHACTITNLVCPDKQINIRAYKMCTHVDSIVGVQEALLDMLQDGKHIDKAGIVKLKRAGRCLSCLRMIFVL